MKDSLSNRFLCIGGWNQPLEQGDTVLVIEENIRKPNKLLICKVEEDKGPTESFVSVKTLDGLRYMHVLRFNTCKITYKGVECAGISTRLVPDK